MTWQSELAARIAAHRELARQALADQAETARQDYGAAGEFVRGVAARPLFPGEVTDDSAGDRGAETVDCAAAGNDQTTLANGHV